MAILICRKVADLHTWYSWPQRCYLDPADIAKVKWPSLTERSLPEMSNEDNQSAFTPGFPGPSAW